MALRDEIKRKLFHHLSLVYLVIYAVLPRWLSLVVMTLGVLIAGAVEWLRLRRPELNARMLALFGGLHRETEIMAPSGIFWTVLGCWVVMVVFVERILGVTAIGFLVFGDTAAALIGQAYGKKPWPKNPSKTVEGSVAFAVVSLVWGLLLVRPHGAVAGSLVAAYLESRRLPWNDNFWIPLGGAGAIAVCLGGRLIHGNVARFVLPRLMVFAAIFFLGMWIFKRFYERERPERTLIDEGDLHG